MDSLAGTKRASPFEVSESVEALSEKGQKRHATQAKEDPSSYNNKKMKFAGETPIQAPVTRSRSKKSSSATSFRSALRETARRFGRVSRFTSAKNTEAPGTAPVSKSVTRSMSLSSETSFRITSALRSTALRIGRATNFSIARSNEVPWTEPVTENEKAVIHRRFKIRKLNIKVGPMTSG